MLHLVDNIAVISHHNADYLGYLAGEAHNNRFLQAIRPMSQFAIKRANDQWGDAWEVYDPNATIMRVEDEWQLHMEFESPWCAPLGAYDMLTEQGLSVLGYVMDTSHLKFSGVYEDGDYTQYTITNTPKYIQWAFEESYDYERLNRPSLKEVLAA